MEYVLVKFPGSEKLYGYKLDLSELGAAQSVVLKERIQHEDPVLAIVDTYRGPVLTTVKRWADEETAMKFKAGAFLKRVLAVSLGDWEMDLGHHFFFSVGKGVFSIPRISDTPKSELMFREWKRVNGIPDMELRIPVDPPPRFNWEAKDATKFEDYINKESIKGEPIMKKYGTAKSSIKETATIAKDVAIKTKSGRLVIGAVKQSILSAPVTPDAVKTIMEMDGYSDMIIGVILKLAADVFTESEIIQRAAESAVFVGSIEVADRFTFLETLLEKIISSGFEKSGKRPDVFQNLKE